MAIYLNHFSIKTPSREVLLDISEKIKKLLPKAQEKGIRDGICRIFVTHTTAGITINENADPDVKTDIIKILADLIPVKSSYLHVEGNSDAHMKTSLMGSSVDILLADGKLILGNWQGIHLCEFDGPRVRKIYVQFQGE